MRTDNKRDDNAICPVFAPLCLWPPTRRTFALKKDVATNNRKNVIKLEKGEEAEKQFAMAYLKVFTKI